MVDNAFRWAGEKKLLRVNSVHGEEEAFLVLSETFELLDETGQTTELNGSIEVEDESGFLLTPDMPSITASDQELLQNMGASASSSGGAAVTVGQSASFKIIFPTVSQNESPVSILANFVEVLGRKIDSCEDQRHWIAAIPVRSRFWVAVLMKHYEKLAQKQAEAIHTVPDQSFNDDLLKTYADITKQDVLLGNYVLRAKSLT
ncbi:unnamed protein product [Symbiodinium sp. CCMP2456]|nr:unnamed protein product [Symbiodinium sp. CCMP2456]